jgi:hypothetical protein
LINNPLDSRRDQQVLLSVDINELSRSFIRVLRHRSEVSWDFIDFARDLDPLRRILTPDEKTFCWPRSCSVENSRENLRSSWDFCVENWTLKFSSSFPQVFHTKAPSGESPSCDFTHDSRAFCFANGSEGQIELNSEFDLSEQLNEISSSDTACARNLPS